MYSTKDAEKAKYAIRRELDFLANDQVINDCINIIDTNYILSLLDKKDISWENLKYLQDLTPKDPIIEEIDIITLVSLFKNQIRESTNGASILYRCLVNEEIMQDLQNSLDVNKDTLIKIFGVQIELMPSVEDIIGLAKPKFLPTKVENLIFKASLKNASI